MTLTLAEFERQLQPLLRDWQVHRLIDGWCLQRAERRIEIVCIPLPAWQAGVLQLPRLDVALFFTGGQAGQDAVFIDDLLRYFRRGGG